MPRAYRGSLGARRGTTVGIRHVSGCVLGLCLTGRQERDRWQLACPRLVSQPRHMINYVVASNKDDRLMIHLVESWYRTVGNSR